jgi:HPt (histidine-containing phosphotransfer) domain-containing protein
MFMENGFDGFISKPIDLRQLDAALNKLVRDRYPPEVVEAARQQLLKLNTAKSAAKKPKPASDPELAVIFTRDAENALTRLKSIHAYAYRRTADIRQFVIDVHAMKSALANIGENALSAAALKLEQAGRAENVTVMMSETPAFIKALSELIDKNKPKEDAGDTAQEEPEHVMANLGEKLLVIQKACEGYDEKTANMALAELKKEKLPRSIMEMLNTVAGYLLHSDFEEAANLVKNYAKG